MALRTLLRRKSKSKISPTDPSGSTDNSNNEYSPYGQYSEKGQIPQQHARDSRDLTRDEQLIPPVPIVQIIRSSTNSQEILSAPEFSPVATNSHTSSANHTHVLPTRSIPGPTSQPQAEKSTSISEASPSTNQLESTPDQTPLKRSNTLKATRAAAGKRLSAIFSRRSRAISTSDIAGVPNRQSTSHDQSREITISPGGNPSETGANTGNGAATQLSEAELQAKWEKRATLLVQGTTQPVSLPPSPAPAASKEEQSDYFSTSSRGNPTTTTEAAVGGGDWPLRTPGSGRSGAGVARVGSAAGNSHSAASRIAADGAADEDENDDDIQLAIQLHESGNLTASTEMFGRLADPAGANNALAQVLYGLALRHGWGIPQNPALAMQYLTTSARNASNLKDSLPTAAGSSSNTTTTPTTNTTAATTATTAATKNHISTLTLPLYELGQSHRNGWGVDKSPALAMEYFEAAAGLGDADAMVEVAMAYEKGVKGWRGGKKDRGMAAYWYRRAERAGRKEVGLSWIWKGKFDDVSSSAAAAAAGGGERM